MQSHATKMICLTVRIEACREPAGTAAAQRALARSTHRIHAWIEAQ